MCLDSDGLQEDTRVYSGSDECPTFNSDLLLLLAQFAVLVTNGRVRERSPKPLVIECVGEL